MQDVWPSSWKLKSIDFLPSEFGFSKKLDDRITEGLHMSQQFIYKLELLRARIGKPLKINSGWRSPEHNAAAKGATHSPHMLGRACDVCTLGWQPWQRKQFVTEARTLGFMGFGIDAHYIHLDDVTRKDGPYTRPLCWKYGAGNKSIALGNVVPEELW